MTSASKRLKKKIYYAQNREDIILQAFFVSKPTGFYVDVGAYDPDVDSVTKIFYQNGWSGINIEPIPERHRLLNKKRPRDINLNMGVSDAESTLTLRSYKNQGLSTFSDDMKKSYAEQFQKGAYDFTYSEAGTREYSDIDVAVKPLASIFAKHKIKKIDFMKVDVEGFEYEALNGNNWQKYRPSVLCIESDNIVRDWRPLLRRNHYKHVFNDGLNDYYVDEKTKEPSKFDYINHVLLKLDGGLRNEHFVAFDTEIKGYKGELSDKKREIEHLHTNVNGLNSRLADTERKLNSTRWLFGRFVGALKLSLTTRLKRLFDR